LHVYKEMFFKTKGCGSPETLVELFKEFENDLTHDIIADSMFKMDAHKF